MAEEEASSSEPQESVAPPKSQQGKQKSPPKLLPAKASHDGVRRSTRIPKKPADSNASASQQPSQSQGNFEGGGVSTSRIAPDPNCGEVENQPELQSVNEDLPKFQCIFCHKENSKQKYHQKHIYRTHHEAWLKVKEDRKEDELRAARIVKRLRNEKKQRKQLEDDRRMNSFFAIDTETNRCGVERWKEVVEVAVVRLDFSEDTGTWTFIPVYHKFFNPLTEISAEAQRCHGQTKDLLVAKGARGFTKNDASEIAAVLHNCRGLIGHNLDFDLQTLNDQFLAVGAGSQAAKL